MTTDGSTFVGRSLCGVVLLAIAAAPAALPLGAKGDDSPDWRTVARPSVALTALPRDEGGIAIGELLQGSAVRVLGRSGDFVKVRVDGWLPAAALVAVPRPLQAEQRETTPDATEDAAKPKPPPPPPPYTDLLRAHHIDVAVELTGEAGARTLEVDLDYVAVDGRRVAPPSTRHTATVRVYPQRPIAGGHARGDLLVARDVEIVEGSGRLALPLALLGDPVPPLVVFSVRVELDAEHELVGSAARLPLPAR